MNPKARGLAGRSANRGRDAKSSLRKAVLARRGTADAGTRADLSRAIVDRITGLDCYRRSGVVLAYASFGSELETDAFVRRALDNGKVLLLPRVDRVERRLDLHEVKDPARDLVAATWGIREPRPDRCPRAEPEAFDFALVPGVAFDPTGGRLGYGGGFYDRLLSGRFASRPSLVAGAFELQVVEEVPVEGHDVRADSVITEGGRYVADEPA